MSAITTKLHINYSLQNDITKITTTIQKLSLNDNENDESDYDENDNENENKNKNEDEDENENENEYEDEDEDEDDDEDENENYDLFVKSLGECMKIYILNGARSSKKTDCLNQMIVKSIKNILCTIN